MQHQKTMSAIEEAVSRHWQITPDRFAHHLTSGKFKRFEHIQYLGRKIAQAVAKGNARIIVSVPPRHGKSWLISLWSPTWFLSLYPEKNVILTSYEADFAANWGRQVRNLMIEHQGELGVKLSPDSQAANRWHTSEGGGMTTAGVGGPITGKGGDLIIVDDPVKNWAEAMSPVFREKTINWWGSTLRTRAEPGASIIVLMTRWHEADLAGYLLSNQDDEHSDHWEEIRLPALAEENDTLNRPIGAALCPERYDIVSLLKLKASVGSKAWNALFQQRPSAEEGNILKREWVRYYTTPQRLEEWIISVDATFSAKASSDFVAMQVWGRSGSQKYLLDRVRERMGITDTIQALVSLSAKWPQATLKLIENKANGPAIEDLLKTKVSGIVLWEPQGDKIARANAVAPQWEAGNVFLPDPSIAPWVHDYVEECVNFPNAAHDDEVDAMTQALLRLEDANSRQVGRMKILRR